MAQQTDIELNGAGYMVQPGTPTNPGYKRLQDGFPEGLTQRTTFTDFFGGQLRAHQLERDRFYTSTNIGPALGGQGVRPWTFISTSSDPLLTTTPSHDTHIPSAVIRNHVYYAIGARLYRRSVVTTDNTSELVKEYPDPITDMCIYGSTGILIAFGSAADLLHRQTTTGTEATLFANERAFSIAAYSGYALWSDARTAANPTIIRMVKGPGIDFRNVNHDIMRIVPVDGEIKLITRQALYSFSGRVANVLVNNPGYTPGGSEPPQVPGQEWQGDFKPFFQQGVYNSDDDFRFIAGFGGRTIAWLAGGIHELVPSGDRAGWRSTGLTGRRCFGGCVAAGYVIVSIESESGLNELWAYDGSGWWRLAHQTMPANNLGVWCNPLDIGTSGPDGFNVLVFSHNSNAIVRLRLNDFGSGSGYRTNYPATAEWLSPLIDASDRDKIKAWRKVGVVFSSPERHGLLSSTDAVTVSLEYSLDAGQSWQLAGSRSLTGNTLANMNFDIEATMPGAVARFIQLRVTWSSVSNWSPILTGAWVEHESLSSPARRRKWQLRIHARDQEVQRNGQLLARTGRQLIEELWAAWELDQPLSYRDIDYDTDPATRTVRIVGIAEHAPQPFDHGNWGDSLITLSLVEV